jgi:poly(3-hydroxybutyrate) depolymerase
MTSLSRFFLVAAACIAATSACAQTDTRPFAAHRAARYAAAAPSTQSSTAIYAGREYNLYVPSSARKSAEVPLLVVLHGALGNADFIERVLGMNAVAEKEGFMVAYLNGTEGNLRIMRDKRTWNAGDCCGIARRKNVDDVSYIRGVIEDLSRKYPVDRSRVYLLGHSNGAMMAYRFICESPGVAAAAVTISGPLMRNSCANPDGLQGVLHIHGSQDDHVPVAGGSGTKALAKRETYNSVEYTRGKLREKGVTVETEILPGTGHELASIAGAMQKTESVPFPAYVWRYLSARRLKP